MSLPSVKAQCKASEPQRPSKKRFLRSIPEHGLTLAVFDSFHSFSRLPLELREMVWEFAMPPRLIPWRHDNPPAVSHACHESRMMWLKKHKFEHWRIGVFDQEPMYIDYSSDAVYFEGMIPGWKDWTDTPKRRLKLPTTPSFYLERFIEGENMGCSRWLEDVQRLAVPAQFALKELALEDFTSGFSTYQSQKKVTPWAKLNGLCPNLKELIVVFGGSLNKDLSLETLTEVGQCAIPVDSWCWRWDLPNFRVKSFEARQIGSLKDVKLSFMEVRKLSTDA